MKKTALITLLLALGLMSCGGIADPAETGIQIARIPIEFTFESFMFAGITNTLDEARVTLTYPVNDETLAQGSGIFSTPGEVEIVYQATDVSLPHTVTVYVEKTYQPGEPEPTRLEVEDLYLYTMSADVAETSGIRFKASFDYIDYEGNLESIVDYTISGQVSESEGLASESKSVEPFFW